MVVDRDRRIRFANEACRRLLGLPEDIMGRRIDHFLKEVDWQGLVRADPAEWQRVSYQEVEVFYPVHRYLRFYLVPLPSNDTDEIQFLAVIFRDVTSDYEMTEKAIEAERLEAVTSLAAAVAHEIGNPLNSLTIHLQLLRRALDRSTDDKVRQEGRRLVNIALEEVQRLDSIIHGFLRAVRPTPPRFERVRIADVVTESLEFMRHEIEGRNILVQVSWPDHLPEILGDPAQLKQAFYNIIRNAVQAMGENGVLRVGGSVEGDFVVLRFADTGKGIAPEDLPRIMEPYFTTREEGTGLGLLIVNRIVRNHGGDLAIESEPGTGTVVTIRLPVRDRHVRLLGPPRNHAAEESQSSENAE